MPLTETLIKAAIGTGFLVSDKLRASNAVEYANTISRMEDFISAVGDYEGPRASQMIGGMMNVRSNLAAAADAALNWLSPGLREYVAILGLPVQSDVLNMQALYLNYALNGKRVKSRGFTYGTIAAVGVPVGNGVIYRNNTDAYGFKIENCYAQTITMECVLDQNNGGTKFKESFRFKGEGANIDNIIIDGSNDDNTFPGTSSDDSSSYFINCSFSTISGALSTKFSGWTISDGTVANWTQDTADYYQITPGDPVAACLSITSNGKIEQAFSRGNTQFPNGAPMMVRAPWKQSGVNAGAQIWLEFGEQIAKVTIGGAESGWQTTLAQELSDRGWYRNYAKNGGKLAISIHGMTSGTIKIDNIIVAPMTKFAGLWFAPCAGSTPFKVGDRYTVSDTCPDTAINQRELVRSTRIYLPHDANASAITWADSVPHT